MVNRFQKTCYRNVLSKFQKIEYGVPQGSILGPLLFLIYVNDLPLFLNSKAILYADDTTLISSNNDLETVVSLLKQAQSDALEWFTNNGLLLNESKCTSMIFSNRTIEDFSNPDAVKFLGVILDLKLTWEKHVDQVCGKLSKTLFLLRKLRKTVSRKILKMVYFSLFQSVFTYGILAWGHSCHLQRIFAIQRKAIRIMLNLGYRDDVREHYKELGLLTVPAVYLFYSLTYTKSNITEYNTHSDTHEYSTRYRDHIYLNYHRIERTRNAVNYYGPKIFNKIPKEIAMLPATGFASYIKKKLLEYPIYDFSQLDIIFN